MKYLNNQQGFTVIELLVATAVFSTVLLVAASGVVYVGRLYNKGITSGLTQEVARTTIDEIAEDFELSGGYFRRLPDSLAGDKGFCIGGNLYSYRLSPHKIALDGSGNAFVVRKLDNCDILPLAIVGPDNLATGMNATGAANVRNEWREFLGANMRLNTLTLTESPGPVRPTSLAIQIDVITGEDDLISSGLCKTGAGSQFCANSPLFTYAVRRIR